MTGGLDLTGELAGLWRRLQSATAREDGQDMVEYALLAALVSVVAVAVIILIGPFLKDMFQDVVNALGSA